MGKGTLTTSAVSSWSTKACKGAAQGAGEDRVGSGFGGNSGSDERILMTWESPEHV